ncbi:MAG: acylneuraminate cytidylyltransferase family protein [Dongiaceae bacterium]
MTWHGHTVLAVVPARGGSKGIPRKNLAVVGGLSLVARAAKVAAALPWLDAAVLTTDDAEIAAEGRGHGLDVPFLRPAGLATDLAGAAETWQHAWLESEAHYGRRFELSVWLQPTSPLRRPEDVERTLRAMVDGGHRAATTVSRVPGHFTPEKLLTLDAEGLVHFYRPDGARHAVRQTIPPYYHRNGLCYAATRETVVDRLHTVEEDCIGVLVEGHVANIDEPIDLEIAQWLADRGGF